jgi:hypothetical protein
MSVVWLLLNKLGDIDANPDIGQAEALPERLVPDAGDAVGDGDAGQAGAPLKRRYPDGGNGITVDYIRDGHRSAWTRVSRDGDGAVIDRVIEFSRRRGRSEALVAAVNRDEAVGRRNAEVISDTES